MAHPFAEHRQTKKEHSRVGHLTKGYASGGAVNRTEDDAKVRKMSASQEREVNPEGGVSPRRADRPMRARGGRAGRKGNAKTVINVITGGDKAAPPPAMGIAGPPPGAMPPPPMAAKPPMMPPPGPGPGMPPPMPMRAKGGRVKSVNYGDGPPTPKPDPRGYYPIQTYTDGKPVYSNAKAMKRDDQYRTGGAVKSKGMVGTKVSHDNGKSDLPDMNRKRVVTFATGGGVKSFMAGGRVEASDAVSPASKLPGGGGGGEARLAKAHRAARK